MKQALIQWQERIDFAHKLLTLLNSYSPPELRNACLGNPHLPRALTLLCRVSIGYSVIPDLVVLCFYWLDVLKELVLLSPHDFLHTLVPFLQHNHCTYHHSSIPSEYYVDTTTAPLFLPVAQQHPPDLLFSPFSLLLLLSPLVTLHYHFTNVQLPT